MQLLLLLFYFQSYIYIYINFCGFSHIAIRLDRKFNFLEVFLFLKLKINLTCCCLVTKSCLTLLQPHELYSPPGSSVHGILQARILERVAFSFSRGSFWPRDQTQVSSSAGGFFYLWAPVSKSMRQILTDIKGEIDSNLQKLTLTVHLHQWTGHPDRKPIKKHRP